MKENIKIKELKDERNYSNKLKCFNYNKIGFTTNNGYNKPEINKSRINIVQTFNCISHVTQFNIDKQFNLTQLT